ncbi:unnamed protein product [Amoebophrya sp. A25]|nr:unnamed protein product [Amoebophrya sp. A25]|eukprot:GSA25T00000802001.1
MVRAISSSGPVWPRTAVSRTLRLHSSRHAVLYTTTRAPVSGQAVSFSVAGSAGIADGDHVVNVVDATPIFSSELDGTGEEITSPSFAGSLRSLAEPAEEDDPVSNRSSINNIFGSGKQRKRTEVSHLRDEDDASEKNSLLLDYVEVQQMQERQRRTEPRKQGRMISSAHSESAEMLLRGIASTAKAVRLSPSTASSRAWRDSVRNLLRDRPGLIGSFQAAETVPALEACARVAMHANRSSFSIMSSSEKDRSLVDDDSGQMLSKRLVAERVPAICGQCSTRQLALLVHAIAALHRCGCLSSKENDRQESLGHSSGPNETEQSYSVYSRKVDLGMLFRDRLAPVIASRALHKWSGRDVALVSKSYASLGISSPTIFSEFLQLFVCGGNRVPRQQVRSKCSVAPNDNSTCAEVSSSSSSSNIRNDVELHRDTTSTLDEITAEKLLQDAPAARLKWIDESPVLSAVRVVDARNSEGASQQEQHLKRRVRACARLRRKLRSSSGERREPSKVNKGETQEDEIPKLPPGFVSSAPSDEEAQISRLRARDIVQIAEALTSVSASVLPHAAKLKILNALSDRLLENDGFQLRRIGSLDDVARLLQATVDRAGTFARLHEHLLVHAHGLLRILRKHSRNNAHVEDSGRICSVGFLISIRNLLAAIVRSEALDSPVDGLCSSSSEMYITGLQDFRREVQRTVRDQDQLQEQEKHAALFLDPAAKLSAMNVLRSILFRRRPSANGFATKTVGGHEMRDEMEQHVAGGNPTQQSPMNIVDKASDNFVDERRMWEVERALIDCVVGDVLLPALHQEEKGERTGRGQSSTLDRRDVEDNGVLTCLALARYEPSRERDGRGSPSSEPESEVLGQMMEPAYAEGCSFETACPSEEEYYVDTEEDEDEADPLLTTELLRSRGLLSHDLFATGNSAPKAKSVLGDIETLSRLCRLYAARRTNVLTPVVFPGVYNGDPSGRASILSSNLKSLAQALEMVLAFPSTNFFVQPVLELLRASEKLMDHAAAMNGEFLFHERGLPTGELTKTSYSGDQDPNVDKSHRKMNTRRARKGEIVDLFDSLPEQKEVSKTKSTLTSSFSSSECLVDARSLITLLRSLRAIVDRRTGSEFGALDKCLNRQTVLLWDRLDGRNRHTVVNLYMDHGSKTSEECPASEVLAEANVNASTSRTNAGIMKAPRIVREWVEYQKSLKIQGKKTPGSSAWQEKRTGS